MKKLSLLLISLLAGQFSLLAQNTVFSTKRGEVSFYSKAPLEDIEAENNMVISLINTGNNEIVVRVPIRQFQFSNKLMQGHYNENYMESERYPHATFKGRINESIDFSKPGTYDVSATGILNVHGTNQKRVLNGKLQVANTGIKLDSKFDILLEDHKIEIPRLVFNKIAEKIAVTASFSYQPYQK